MDQVEWIPLLIRIGLIFLGGAVTLAVTMLGIFITRMYANQALLFKKLDNQAREIHTIQMAIIALEPKTRTTFRAFMLKDGDG